VRATSVFARSPEASFFMKPSAIASFGTSMVRAGRHGRTNRTAAVQRKVVSRTDRCSAGEEFMNAGLAMGYTQETTG
jgi:hypothetical protein